MVRVTTSRPSHLTGSIGERVLGFATQDGLEHIGYLGVHALAEPGVQALTVIARAEDGAEVTLVTTLQVLAGEYESETLTFSPQVSELLAPEILQAEEARMAELFAIFTPAVPGMAASRGRWAPLRRRSARAGTMLGAFCRTMPGSNCAAWRARPCMRPRTGS